MPAPLSYVFIDTQAFDQHQLDFSSPSLCRLKRLIESDELSLVLTDITVSEIRSHLRNEAERAIKQISNYKRASRVVKHLFPEGSLASLANLTEESLAATCLDEFAKFLSVTKAIIIPVDKVSPSTVFARYFDASPPFHSSNKKSEFPDAFASAALQSWCEDSPERKLYIVSDDGDWRAMCDETAAFCHVRRLEQLLELFVDSELAAALKESPGTLTDEAHQSLELHLREGRTYFAIDDSVIDGDAEHATLNSFAIVGVDVIEAAAGEAILGTTCLANITIDVTGDDPDSMWKDEDGSRHSVFTVEGSVERDIELEATIAISYDVRNPRQFTVQSIQFQDEEIEISVDSYELHTNYGQDEDDEEFDPQWEPDDVVDDEIDPA